MMGDGTGLTFREYDEGARALAAYPPSKVPFYPVLGLCGDAGEVAEMHH